MKSKGITKHTRFSPEKLISVLFNSFLKQVGTLAIGWLVGSIY